MNKREFCRISDKRSRFAALFLCACLFALAVCPVSAASDMQSTADDSGSTLTAVYAMGGYTVTLDEAVYVDDGKDDGKMLTDRVYTSVTAKKDGKPTVGWVKIKGVNGNGRFSATVDIDFGHTARGVCRFYLRAFRDSVLNAEMPEKITFFYSLDGKDFVKAGNATTLSDVTAENCAAVYSVVLDEGVTCKYLRAVIECEGNGALWLNEIGAAAYKDTEYAYKLSNGSIADVNGIVYTLKDGSATVTGYNARPKYLVASKSDDDFNSDENGYVLGIGTGNAVKIIPDFIGDGRINYSGVPNNIKYIVIHNTGTTEEETDAARYNRRMHTTPEETSWHYTVDEDLIYHSLADSAVGWHAGSGLNYESIGIEICVNGAPKRSSGAPVFEGEKYDKWVEERFDRSLRNAAVLVAELLTRYGLDESAVIQHYDATEKNCPQWLRYKNGKYVYNGTLWERFTGYVSEYYGMLNFADSKGTLYYSTEISVPDYISFDGCVYPVTAFSSTAFADIEAPIRSITVGNEVRDIPYGCFDGNPELELVRIKSGNTAFRVDGDGAVYSSDGSLIYDPNAYTSVAPTPKESCTLDIREVDGKYYIFCDDERYTLAELAENYGASEYTASRIDGSFVESGEIPGTGTVLCLDGVRLYLVLLGDVNGDAELDSYDYILVKRTCMNTYSPLKRQTLAMILKNGSEVTVYDYILLKRHIMGTYSIFTKV